VLGRLFLGGPSGSPSFLFCEGTTVKLPGFIHWELLANLFTKICVFVGSRFFGYLLFPLRNGGIFFNFCEYNKKVLAGLFLRKRVCKCS
jgi:hypothetical protein